MTKDKNICRGAFSLRTKVIDTNHPDPCYVVRNSEDTKYWSAQEGIFVFSTSEKAQDFIDNDEIENGFAKFYTWSELVDKFRDSYKFAIIDCSCDCSWYHIVPLLKDCALA